MQAANERRHHSRYPASQLQVRLKSSRHRLGQWEQAVISSVDFNRYGIGLETANSYSVGEILELLIRTDDATTAEISGLVCNRTQTEQGFRLGIQFGHAATENNQQADISGQILLIERQIAGLVH